MRKNWIIVVYILLLFQVSNLTAQQIPSGFVKEPVEIDVQKTRSDMKVKLKRSHRNEVTFTFNEGFSDSLHFYVNGHLHLRAFVESDTLGRGYAVAAVNVIFDKPKAKVTIVLPQGKVFTKFVVRRKYILTKIHRLDSVWYIVQTNLMPIYQ